MLKTGKGGLVVVHVLMLPGKALKTEARNRETRWRPWAILRAWVGAAAASSASNQQRMSNFETLLRMYEWEGRVPVPVRTGRCAEDSRCDQ